MKPKPYRPSNGTEGMIFEDNFCCRCRKRSKPCHIRGNALAFEKDDKHYPKQLTYDDEGEPTCTAFDDKSIPRPQIAPRCRKTGDLFQ
jgi:hypothetical protein